MKPRVVLVGVGGIGRHHMASLVNANAFDVQVVDSSTPALEGARSLQASTPGASVQFLRDIGGCWNDPDLTIVATQASGRVALVEALLALGHRTILLEKIVTSSIAEYEKLMSLVDRAGAQAWVNAPMRHIPLFQELAPSLTGRVIALSAAGADLGLATNAIHFVDLFMFLRGEWSLRLGGDMLSPGLLPNKRGSDLVEFGGSLVGIDDSGSTLCVTNLPISEATQTIAVTSEPLTCFIEVSGGTAHLARRSDRWETRTIPYREARVSEVTALAAADIVRSRSCRFPSLEEAYGPHRELLRVFRGHLMAVRGESPEPLPIT